MQALLDDEGVMHGGHNCEDEGGAQKDPGCDLDQEDGFDQKQQNEKNCRYLGEGVGLSEDAGAEIPHPGNHEKNAANQQDGNVAAENQHSIFPGDHSFDREHEKHGAH